MPTSAWEKIEREIRSDIESGRLIPGASLPSESLLAETHGVSRMTIHRALSTLQRDGYVTRRPRVGTVVRRREVETPVRTLALVFYNANVYPQANYIQGIAASLLAQERTLLMDTHDRPEEEVRLLKRAADTADAVLAYPTSHPRVSSTLCEVAARMPVVLVDRVPAGVDVDAFVSDERPAIEEALRGLTARGHRRIAHFTDRAPHVSTIVSRAAAHAGVLREIGESPETLVRSFPAADGWDFNQFVLAIGDALAALRTGPSPVTAVFCANDAYMAATLAACERLSLRVPEDLEIVSIQDYPLLPVLRLESVHRIVPDTREIGRLAVDRVHARLADPGLAPEVVRVPATLRPAAHALVP